MNQNFLNEIRLGSLYRLVEGLYKSRNLSLFMIRRFPDKIATTSLRSASQ